MSALRRLLPRFLRRRSYRRWHESYYRPTPPAFGSVEGTCANGHRVRVPYLLYGTTADQAMEQANQHSIPCPRCGEVVRFGEAI